MNETLTTPAIAKQPLEKPETPENRNIPVENTSNDKREAIEDILGAQPLVRDRVISREYLEPDEENKESIDNQHSVEVSGDANQTSTEIETNPNIPVSNATFTTTSQIYSEDKHTPNLTQEVPTKAFVGTTSSTVHGNSTHGYWLPEHRNSPTTRDVTLKSVDTTVAADMVREVQAAATRPPPGGGVDSASPGRGLLLVPLTLAVLLIICSVLLFLFVRKRRRRKRKRKETEIETEKQELFDCEGNGPVYAMVDLSKKKKKIITVPPSESEMLQLLPTSQENGHCLSQTQDPYGYKDHTGDNYRTSPTPLCDLYQTLDCPVMVDESPAINQALVENEIYESTEMLNRKVSETDDDITLQRPPPTYIRRDLGEMRASKDLPPLPQCVGAHSEDTDCPVCCTSSESDSDSNLDQQVYLSPSCHDHPPQGPNWKPFHPYDPVYVPTTSAGDMDRRVDSTGYVSRKNMRTNPQVYEEINYSALNPPPLKPKMIMGATASGGRKPAPRMLPVTPRNSVNNDTGAYGLTAIAAGLSASTANGAHGANTQVHTPHNSQGVQSNNAQPLSNHAQNGVPESSVVSVNDSIQNPLSRNPDRAPRSRDSRTSSTASSNKDDMYETVEFPDLDV